MRLISIQEAARQAREALVRFPLVLVSAGVAAGAGLALVDHGSAVRVVRVLLAALLGIPLLTAVAATAERAGWRRPQRRVVELAAILALFAFWLASGSWTESTRTIRFAQLVVALHLAAATLPFFGTPAHRGFWQYNRIQFLRFLTATLYAGVLFCGLAVALVAIDHLFGVKVDEDWYKRLWVVIALVFHPWFFLGGVPRDLNALDAREDYPGGLKVFAQFILIPVVSVYLLILTAYLVRVVVTRTWPSGWIGWLVSSVSASGTLALLLVHPVRERADSRWVDTYGRWFYVALLPSIAMLLMAIWLRVHQYGVTEQRYFLTVVGLWLAAIALYYGVTGSRNIRVIPTTLGLLALVTFVGPWSAYSASRHSQIDRFRRLLLRYQILEDSRVRPPVGEITFEDRSEMSAVVRYLIEKHGASSLGDVAGELRQVAENAPSVTGARDDPARAVMDRVGVPYVERWQGATADQVAYFSGIAGQAIPLDGYEWMARVDLAARVEVPLGPDTLTFTPATSPPRSIVTRRGRQLLEIPLEPLLQQARATQQGAGAPAPAVRTPPGGAPLAMEAEGGGLRLRVLVENLSGRGSGASAQLYSAGAQLLLQLGPETR